MDTDKPRYIRGVGMKIIAHIYTDFPTKFGIPRQSGLIDDLKGMIIMEPEYRNPEAFRGLEEFSHIWLLWKFSESKKEHFSATVKPPRLGGKKRMGVFATRSPFRPNDIGLSCVRLERIELDSEKGPILHVAGIDLMDNTPIYDIKPYIAYTDSHPEAKEGFTSVTKQHQLTIAFPDKWLDMIPKEKRKGVYDMLSQDPRPAYDLYPDRIYGIEYAGFDIRFCVNEDIVTVCEIIIKK